MSPTQIFGIRYYRHGAIVLVRVEGPLTRPYTSGLLRPVLSLFKKKVYDVVIDLTVTTELDTAGVESLQELSSVLINVGRPPLAIVAPPRSRPEAALRSAGSPDDLRIFPTTDAAYEANDNVTVTEKTESLEEEDLYLTIYRYEVDSVVVFEIKGELDVEEVRQVKQRLLTEIEAGNKFFVLDMKHVDFVDSSALGLFAGLKKTLPDLGGDVRFSRLSTNVRRVFEVFRLPKLYQTFDRIEDAIISFQS